MKTTTDDGFLLTNLFLSLICGESYLGIKVDNLQQSSELVAYLLPVLTNNEKRTLLC